MKELSKSSGWVHSIVATDENQVVSVTSRGFSDKAAGFLHNFLEVPLNTKKNRALTNTTTINEEKLYSVLELFNDYQEYKEIEFLKVCLAHLRKEKGTDSLVLTFHNN